jgi:hypothetical protein
MMSSFAPAGLKLLHTFRNLWTPLVQQPNVMRRNEGAIKNKCRFQKNNPQLSGNKLL